MAKSVQQFDSLVAESEFVFAVFYRGHWCPFCISWIKDLQRLVPEIQQKRGTAVIVTAEEEKFLTDVLAKTKFSGKTITDPDTSLVKELKSRNLVSVAITDRGGYPHGMIQPAVLVVNKEGKVIYQWAIQPSMMNLGGAKDRVSLQEVWEDVQGILTGDKTSMRTHFSRQSLSAGLKQKMFG
ncbi:hypothetical protein BDY17DRAFT_295813 [Neohortaea acidophila]|uniref:Alkyl hydroperoxide reductase subunit C/ Thiol specific antioxidant domain-containing protein n=1 Tax=Neohortaea acidophila TaxID=245834 RepID=A0A6A6PWY0_9PEZI|nr:uncharacterized protein BDY17DRAFT_295813 [Neohortaea acidophila]KAF2484525.1 hypothetical protein BDY17DRAFT_295813 [Neohortaea acidophila]